jgi:hypothetical protein
VRRTVLLLITVGALAACGSSGASRSVAASATATAAAQAHCGPASAQTLARGSLTRVFVQRGTVYACLTGSRRWTRLGTTGGCLRASRVDVVAVAGRLVAAGVTTCGIDISAAAIEVLRVSDGHRLLSAQAIGNPGPEASMRVTGLVLTPEGAVAWIARTGSIADHRTVTEVRAASGAGTRVLDSSPQIATGSLRLSGRTVSWRDGSGLRSAELS